MSSEIIFLVKLERLFNLNITFGLMGVLERMAVHKKVVGFDSWSFDDQW